MSLLTILLTVLCGLVLLWILTGFWYLVANEKGFYYGKLFFHCLFWVLLILAIVLSIVVLALDLKGVV